MTKAHRNFAYLAFSFFLVLIFSIRIVSAQTASDVASRQAQLQTQLDQLESEINAQETILQTKQKERTSLERDVAILDAQIATTKLGIKARELEIAKLTSGIGEKNQTIGVLSAKIQREKDSLADLLRKTDEIDSYSLVEMVLSNQNLSGFFADIDSFNSIQENLHNSFVELGATKTETEAEKQDLQDKKDEQVQLRAIQLIEQKKIQAQEAEKKKIVAEAKGQEAIYEKIIADKAKSAASIRSQLFLLTGSNSIPFGKALEYATIASAKTGVRPAVILGILAEESNLGENIGTGNWRVDMKNPRDTVPFQDICSRLGLNPDQMPVSKKAWYGWGGAMGPAQFIPSTWVQYESRIASLSGHTPPNPWNPYDAIMASAMLMKDNGADGGTYSTERLAALRYLAGWTNAKKAAYAFYGNDVMALADKYQQQINILQNN